MSGYAVVRVGDLARVGSLVVVTGDDWGRWGLDTAVGVAVGRSWGGDCYGVAMYQRCGVGVRSRWVLVAIASAGRVTDAVLADLVGVDIEHENGGVL